MDQYKIIAVVLVALVSVFNVQAQSNPPPTTCQTATGMTNVNATLFAGDWYEEVRAPAINISCVHVNVAVINNQTQLNVTLNYGATKMGLLQNRYASANVNVSKVNENNGINVTYSNVASNTTYKILDTDYSSYISLCGYTNVSDASTSFGVILTRKQVVNSTWLTQLKINASKLLSGFNDSTTANILQSKDCHNSAATSVPALATLFAAFYALLKMLKC